MLQGKATMNCIMFKTFTHESAGSYFCEKTNTSKQYLLYLCNLTHVDKATPEVFHRQDQF